MQQGQGIGIQNGQQNEIAETEDDGIDVGTSKQSKIVVVILIAIFISAVIYFMFLRKSPEDQKENTVSNDELIVGGKGTQPIRDKAITDVDYNATDLLDTVPTTDESLFNTQKTEDKVPALPELPKLPDEIKQQISSGVNVKKDDTYTKEEVDKIVEEKMKELMEKQITNGQQQVIASPTVNTVDATPVEDKKVDNAKKNDEDLELKIMGGDTTLTSDIEKTDEEKIMDKQKQEENNLEKMKKNKAMQERQAAPIFKMSGGSGPASSSVSTESDPIVLSYTDSKLDVKSKEPDVIPTQVNDLTRSILQGKVISAVLESAIDTSLSSTVRAVITRDVYAEEGKNILIPKGSRVVGTYDTAVASGQTRVTINWNRIIRVDGMSLNITSIGADRLGRAGVEGDLDNKYAERLANSFLSSVLSIATSIASEKVSGSTGTSTTLSSLTGSTTTTSSKASDQAIVDATQNFMDEAQSIVDNIAEQKPVIRIPQGQKLIIMVTQDVTLPIFKKGE